MPAPAEVTYDFGPSMLPDNPSLLGGVRNLESQGRQLYARHLYCLMLLLMDENYIAPWDENDPQLRLIMDEEAERDSNQITSQLRQRCRPNGVGRGRRDRQAQLTCQMIAQWAVNCVDMRDSDVIMTPFEYDENPWDGWGVWSDILGLVRIARVTFVKVNVHPTPRRRPKRHLFHSMVIRPHLMRTKPG